MKKELCILFAALVAVLTFAGCSRDDGSKAFSAGREAFDARDYRKASINFEKCLALQATNVDALVYLARAQLGLGELPGAQKAIAAAQNLAGADLDVRLLSAQIAWHMKDYSAASRGFAAVANDAKLAADLRAEGWTGLGIVEMTLNRRDAARVDFLRAIRLDRRNAAARYHLGLLYRDGFGYPEAALEELQVFVRLGGAESTYVQKAERVFIPGLQEAIQRKAVSRVGASKRDSSTAASLIAKAETAWNRGNFKTAKQNYIEAARSDPLSYPAAVGVAQAWLKTDATKRGLENAFKAYSQACQLKPSAIAVSLEAAKLAMRLGYASQAVEIYSRALAADPVSIAALDGLIGALRRAGGAKGAAQAYQAYRDMVASSGKKK